MSYLYRHRYVDDDDNDDNGDDWDPDQGCDDESNINNEDSDQISANADGDDVLEDGTRSDDWDYWKDAPSDDDAVENECDDASVGRDVKGDADAETSGDEDGRFHAARQDITVEDYFQLDDDNADQDEHDFDDNDNDDPDPLPRSLAPHERGLPLPTPDWTRTPPSGAVHTPACAK